MCYRKRVNNKQKIAEQALKEAENRKKKANNLLLNMPKEINGPLDLEPTRYGDWERKGIISDF